MKKKCKNSIQIKEKHKKIMNLSEPVECPSLPSEQRNWGTDYPMQAPWAAVHTAGSIASHLATQEGTSWVCVSLYRDVTWEVSQQF